MPPPQCSKTDDCSLRQKIIIGESENVKRDCGVLVGAFGGSKQSIPVLPTPVSDFFPPQAVRYQYFPVMMTMSALGAGVECWSEQGQQRPVQITLYPN